MNTPTLSEMIDKVIDVEAKAQIDALDYGIQFQGAEDIECAQTSRTCGYNVGFKAGARAVGTPLAAALIEALEYLSLQHRTMDYRGHSKEDCDCSAHMAESAFEKIRSILEKAVGDA